MTWMTWRSEATLTAREPSTTRCTSSSPISRSERATATTPVEFWDQMCVPPSETTTASMRWPAIGSADVIRLGDDHGDPARAKVETDGFLPPRQDCAAMPPGTLGLRGRVSGIIEAAGPSWTRFCGSLEDRGQRLCVPHSGAIRDSGGGWLPDC